jgi:CheY-specific phosphatase CheX
MTKFIICSVLACVSSAVAQEPRREGVVRIGVVQPRVDMGPGAGGSGEAFRTLVSRYLSGPSMEIVPVQAMVPAMVEAEAKEKGYDFVLYATLTQQAPKKSGGLGLLKGARAMSGVVPVVGMSGRTGAVVAQAAAQTAISVAAEVSSGVKAKSEVTLEYRLVAPGAASPAAANTEKVKAETDGQDVVTPMVEHMAATVVGAAVKR